MKIDNDSETPDSDCPDEITMNIPALSDVIIPCTTGTRTAGDDEDDGLRKHADGHLRSSIGGCTISNDNGDTDNTTRRDQLCYSYQTRKPKWWRDLSPRKPTKAQRRWHREMDAYTIQIKSQTSEGWSSYLDWDQVFNDQDGFDKYPGHNDDNSRGRETPTTRRRRIHLEIGFGNGHNLLCLAEQFAAINTGDCIVGCEMHVAAPCKVLRIMQLAQQNQCYWTGYTRYSPNRSSSNTNYLKNDDSTGSNTNNIKNKPYHVLTKDSNCWRPFVTTHNIDVEPSTTTGKSSNSNANSRRRIPYSNVRVMTGDGYKLVSRTIPSHSLTSILITFPDPFPNHLKYRLIQNDTAQQFHRVLLLQQQQQLIEANNDNQDDDDDCAGSCCSTGGRVYLATDHAEYFEWSVAIFDNAMATTSCKHNGTRSRDDGSADKVRNRNRHENEGGPIKDPTATTTICTKLFERILPCPPRTEWLPVVSAYEQKGWNEGRSTHLACWRAINPY